MTKCLPAENVSILIPAWRPPCEFLKKSLESALRTSCSEVIISFDDYRESDDFELKDLLLSDSRIIVHKHLHNLGLWENHKFLVTVSNCEWIKFLQQDDFIKEEGLEILSRQIKKEVSIISCIAEYYNYNSSQYISSCFDLKGTRTWFSNDYLMRMPLVGNELGPPSCTLIRRSALAAIDNEWSKEFSCDFIMNVHAASYGSVVLVPAGPVVIGVHDARDGVTQTYELAFSRLVNTCEALRKQSNPVIRQNIYLIFGASEAFSFIAMGLNRLLRRRPGPDMKTFLKSLLFIIGLMPEIVAMPSGLKSLLSALVLKYSTAKRKKLYL